MEPLIVEFEVAAAVPHAFDVWVQRASWWWPRSHTVSRSADLAVVFEPFPGGRIYERTGDGTEHEWGEVTSWEPPNRISYLWHLFFDRSEATQVEVTFQPVGDGTRVRIEQTGWAKLGDEAAGRRANTHRAWSAITALYQEAAAGG